MPSAIHVPSVPDRLTRLPLSRPDLRLLDAIGQCGDLAEAARRAGLRAAAAERRLDRLDQATGLRLTLRDTRTARLSTEGARVLVAGRRFFRQVDQAVQTEIYGRGTEALNAPRILDIATAEPLMEDLVEDAADTLGILLSVSHDTPLQVLRQLDGYRVDAAHTWGLDVLSHAVDRTVRTYDVLDDPLWVTLPVGHPLAGRDTVSLADLSDENWVSEAGPRGEVLVSRVYQSAGLTPPARIQVAGASVARGMLRRGDAVGLGSPACPAVFAPSLVRRSLRERPRRAMRPSGRSRRRSRRSGAAAGRAAHGPLPEQVHRAARGPAARSVVGGLAARAAGGAGPAHRGRRAQSPDPSGAARRSRPRSTWRTFTCFGRWRTTAASTVPQRFSRSASRLSPGASTGSNSASGQVCCCAARAVRT